MKTAYVSGPMRNYPLFNFPSFDKARDILVKQGWRVISPADLDRAIGFDEKSPEGYLFDIHAALKRDFLAILQSCTDIVLLPGWQKSVGAKAELFIAQTIGLPAWEIAPEIGDLTPLTIKLDVVWSA